MTGAPRQEVLQPATAVELVALSDICSSIADGDHQAPPQADAGIPFITISALQNDSIELDRVTRFVPKIYMDSLPAQRRPEQGDVLFSVAGSIGRVGIVEDNRFVFQRHIAILKSSDIVLPKYLYHMMRSPQVLNQATSIATGTAQLTVPLNGLRKIVIPLSSINAQHRIVAKIDSLTARSKQARNQLDRVQALIDGYCAATLKTAYQAASQIAPLNEVGRIIEDCRYGTAAKCHSEAQGTPVLRIPNVSGGTISISDLKYGTLEQKEAHKLALRLGDILIVRSNGSPKLVGVAAQVGSESEGMAFAGYLIRIRTKNDMLIPDYLIQMLRSPQLRTEIERSAKSTSGVHNINSAELAALKIPLPSVEHQRRIVSSIKHTFAAIDRLAAEARSAQAALDKLDQAILAKAFRGELVPQDANEEPASVLLDRIRAERTAAGPAPKRGRRPRGAAA